MELTAVARPLVIVSCAVVGLAIGSFLNVVVHRVPRAMSLVRPASHCPQCGTELAALDNVPLFSWLVLRGRCRYCRAPISIRYPLVELSTAALFAGTAAAVGSWAPLAPVLAVVAASVAAVGIDADHTALPLSVALATSVGVFGLVAVSLTGGNDGRLAWAALGAVVSTVAVAAWASDRGRTSGTRLPPLILAGALGWTIGWLWPPGGPVLAGLALFAAGLERSGSKRRKLPLSVLVAGGLALVVAGAAVGTR